MARIRKKRVVKKSQPSKSTLASLELKNKNIGVMLTLDFRKAEIINTVTLNRLKPSRESTHLSKLIVDYPHRWNYIMFSLCRDQKGEEYIVFGEVDIKDEKGTKIPVFQSEIDLHLDKAHKEFNKNFVNTYHLLNTGWLALPYNPEKPFDYVSIVDSYCNIYGCWDYISKYEAERDEE